MVARVTSNAIPLLYPEKDAQREAYTEIGCKITAFF